jgi:hypothetical protein
MERNEKNSSTIASDFQTTSESSHSGTSSLRGALVHLSQAKLLLRRARAESLGHDLSECLNRLLQGVDRIGSSLEWSLELWKQRPPKAPLGGAIPAVCAGDANLTCAGSLL